MSLCGVVEKSHFKKDEKESNNLKKCLSAKSLNIYGGDRVFLMLFKCIV